MVVDTSALVAIVRNEPECDEFLQHLAALPSAPLLSAVSWMEAHMVVLSRLGDPGIVALREVMDTVNLMTVPVLPEVADAAFEAFRRFGKGRHPAALNFGDCFSYALATIIGEPLLFKGGDFAKTDVVPAVTSL
jgi:ribonuclease VapC